MTSVPILKIKIEKIVPHWNLFTAAKNRLASGLNSTPGVLGRLARLGSTSVQQRVAENRSTDFETLDLLAQHQSSDVRSAVAQNVNTRESTTQSLAEDANADVRYAMAENPWTSTTLLEMLAGDDNPYVQHRAMRTQALLKAEQILLDNRATMAVPVQKACNPFVAFCLQLFKGDWHTSSASMAKYVPVTMADLAILPKDTQLLVAHCLERNNSSLSLFRSDTDVSSLLSTGWLVSTPAPSAGVIDFQFMPRLWRQLKSLQEKFLSRQLLSDLETYRKGKSASYPWVW